MNWVFEHFQVLIAIAAAIAYFLNLNRVKNESGEAGRASGETDEARAERTRKLQEEIRRKIADRRAASGGASSSAPVRPREVVPPLVRPTNVPPIDPFGGPLRRIVREMQEASERQFEPEREGEREEAAAKAMLARQEKLTEEMRALEAARLAEQRRATEIAMATPVASAAGAGVVPVPGDLGRQLRDPRELRRAFVLREVIGAPVGLR